MRGGDVPSAERGRDYTSRLSALSYRHAPHRPRSQPLLRPRGALCARRRQCRRRGGADRRLAAVRFRSRPRQERAGTRRRARRAEGPDHEGGAAPGHHPGRAAGRICHRADEAAEPGAADGLGVRQAAHAGGARRRLAGEIRELRAPSGRGRLARPGAPRPRARRQRARLQAAVCRHAVGGRSRPEAVADHLRHPSPHGPGDRHHRDRQGDRRAHPRGAGLLARGQARRALPADARRHRRDLRAAGVARAFDRAATDARLARGPQAARPQGRRPRNPQPHRRRHVQGLVVDVQPLRRDPRRPASRQLQRVRRRPEKSRAASTCSTTAASASSRRSSSAAWSTSTTGCAKATTT